jgi:hypothetical protein
MKRRSFLQVLAATPAVALVRPIAEPLDQPPGRIEPLPTPDSYSNRVPIGPDGRIMAVGSDHKKVVWDGAHYVVTWADEASSERS